MALLAENNMNLKKQKGLIIFVRHGQTDWNLEGKMQGREDIPLNSQGLSDARLTAIGIKNACDKTGIVFDTVIASPLLRASVTGKIIAEKIGCNDFYCDERVTERDFGELSSLPYDKNSKAITTDMQEYPSLERVQHLVDRVNSFILEKARLDKNILVVTHGAVTRIFADNAKKAEGYTITAPFLLNCHLVVYKYDGTEPVLIGYNISSQNLDEFLSEVKYD